MSSQNLFSKVSGTPAQILIILGLAVTLFVPLWRQMNEVAVSKAQAKLDQAGDLVKTEVEKFKKGQDADLKSVYENPALSVDERLQKRQGLQEAAYAKRDELQRSYDESDLKRALMSARARAVDTRWPDIVGWLGRLMLMLGLLIMTIQNEGVKQIILLVILLVAMLSSLASIEPERRQDFLGRPVPAVSHLALASDVPTSISSEIAKLSESLPPPPPPPPPPGSATSFEMQGIPGGVPGGVIGGILGGVPSSSAPPPSSSRAGESAKLPDRIRVTDQEANLIRRVNPVYPQLAKAARIQGSVVLEVTVSKQGTVQNVSVLSGHPILVQAAIDAVRQWIYRPVLLNGQPVEVVTTVTVNFKLE
ncbi:MAG: energy transducer TonB [Acidobacteriia bacterium]|nr:energy transducer TonB [Terriglobia bacterium]